mgnify:CR=1 FL=1
MTSKTTPNAKNLEALGAKRLAELLIEISTGSAMAKRRLRLEPAGAQSPKEVKGISLQPIYQRETMMVSLFIPERLRICPP